MCITLALRAQRLTPALPILTTGKCIGQTTEFQAGKEAPRRHAEKEKRGETARTGRAQGKRPASAGPAEALTAVQGSQGGVPDNERAGGIIAATTRWLEQAVIGLQLCPFAAGPHLNDRIRYCVSAQRSSAGLLDELSDELRTLQDADPLKCETTLLIHPLVLTDFRDYNEFLDECDAAVVDLGLKGEMQVASFHPLYQFAGTDAQDIGNYTNRSPYPMLHLLREESITRATARFPDIDGIGARNVNTLRRLGHEGWRRLWLA